MAGELQELAQVRSQLDALAVERQALQVKLRQARDRLVLLDRQGAARSVRSKVEKQISNLETAAADLSLREGGLLGRIDRLRGQIRLSREEDSVETLDGQVPVLLLPVRLETRFMPGIDELRVRIYPEQIHIDAHEPGLTTTELATATAYWDARWAATSTEEHAAAWREVLRTVRPARARWLVTITEPKNLGQIGTGTPTLPDDIELRAGPFTRQPTARLLPEQWVAIGFRNGTEVARVWGDPITEGIPVGLPPDLDDDGTTSDVPDDQDTLALDDSIAWLVDYDKALAAGMAITITDGDVQGGQLDAGFDELVVVGVDWGADPQAASASIDEQLRRHAFTDGLSVLGPGVPTNNTDDSRSAPGTDPELDGTAFDPATVAAAPATVVRVGTALGVDPAVGLDRAPATGSLDDGAAGDMNNTLWAATLGAFLDQMMAPVVTSRVADGTHDHFRRYVRGQGPYVALRIGAQPYGVLPVTAGAVNTGDSYLDGLATRLGGLRPFWTQAVDSVPRLGDSNQPDVDAVELLRRTPRSSTFRFRQAFAGSASSSILGFDIAAVFQEVIANLTLALAGIQGRPRIAGITLDPTGRNVPVPLISSGDLAETDRLDPDYISEVLSATTTSGGFRELLSQPGKANTLFEALLRQAAGAEYVIGSTLLILTHEVETQVIAQLPVFARAFDPEVIGIATTAIRPDANANAPQSILGRVESPVEIAETTIRALSGNRTIANHLAVSTNADLRRRVPTRRFAEFRISLGRLAKLPSAELDRLAGSTLDCVSHRLDAWLTSMATRHLDTLRTERGRDTYIGGFGYVEDLRPSADPVSRGFLHGPSVGHATTAAILRSGHLARGETDEGTFAVDLSSRRVSRALDLLDGVRRGQPIGALLGYLFERSLRDTDMTLAKYILPIRQRSPLAQVSTGPDPANDVLESIAARDVVDGIALLEAWRPNPNTYWASVPVPTADRAALNGLLEALEDALDAVSDLLVAESVHQAVLGNAERSAAALDALDRQQPLPDLGVIRTPRTATGLGHRLLVLFDGDEPAPGWTMDDPRRRADPRVDAWCGAVLGDPSRFRLAAEVRDAAETVLQTVSCRLSDLGLSALSVIAASAAAGTDATELEQRLALRLRDEINPANVELAAELRFLDDPPAGAAAGSLGLRHLLELTDEISGLLAAARPADARTLLPDTERPASGVDLGDLKDRADAARSTLTDAVEALDALTGGSPVEDIVDALLAAADAGITGAAPGPEPPLAQAERVELNGRSTLQALDDAEAAFAAKLNPPPPEPPPVVTDEDHANHHLQRLRLLFGEGFPAVIRFKLPGAVGPDTEDFRTSLAASNADPALVGTNLVAASWLGMHVPVRPAVARLCGVLEASEMLGGRLGLADVHVAQLPHRPGAAWVGLPFDTTPPATTSFVVHTAARPDFAGTLAGVVVDQWAEAIPSTTETTGVSFHFDAPGARAPQTMLIATPTDRAAMNWTVDSLAGTVREAVALARIRPLDIDDVDVAARFLPAAYLPFNLEAKLPWLNLSAIIIQAVALQNELFKKADA